MIQGTYIGNCQTTATWDHPTGIDTTGNCPCCGQSVGIRHIVAIGYHEPAPELKLDLKPKKKPVPAPPYQNRLIKSAEHKIRHEAQWMRYAGLPMYSQTRRRAVEQKVGG